jgi:ATP-dependent Lon protease
MPSTHNLEAFLKEKTEYIQNVIRNTITSIKFNNILDVFSNNDTNLSLSILDDLYDKTIKIEECLDNKDQYEELLNELQTVIDKLSLIICGFGTKNVEDLLFVCFGSEYQNIKFTEPIINDKFKIIKQHINPIGYKINHWKTKNKQKSTSNICIDKIGEGEVTFETVNTLECFDYEIDNDKIYQKILGIRVIIQNEKAKKTLIINGIVDDLHLNNFSNKYITEQKKLCLSKTIGRPEHETLITNEIINSMILKDVLIYSANDIIKKTFAVLSEVNNVKQTKLEITIKRFTEMDLYTQRNILINLLLYKQDEEIQYICYLLYEVVAVKSDNDLLYDTLPWKLKQEFNEMISCSSKKANDIMKKYEANQVTLEQQVYLMKASDSIKEKAMLKLKEIKGKPDEMCLKAKQYIEGLLKIPFGMYREEPILRKVKDLNDWYIRIENVIINLFPSIIVYKKSKYTTQEIMKNLSTIRWFLSDNLKTETYKVLDTCNNKQLLTAIQKINLTQKEMKYPKLSVAKKSRSMQMNSVCSLISNDIQQSSIVYDNANINSAFSLSSTVKDISLIENSVNSVNTEMEKIMDTMEESVYGHKHAKNQIMKIIGQWMNGEQTGYCFGFEGSPGIGKTSLAKKGISKCLKNDNSDTRPFSFIALGGSCNGSTIEGHSYTYLNSTWGRIVDILMDSKCMNPIIYIDELDKVSKTENGREIIGIFTHLIDQTQNEVFQDKYFSGIDIDLSKALFIFSYNDPDHIDKVLLDRIHRIKFDNLTIDDKRVIVNNYILPEINKKMGFENVVCISNDMIEYIIESYTAEPGVRKLKEILFDLYGEINLEILKSNDSEMTTPIEITKDNIDKKYLKRYHKVNSKKIHNSCETGVINGLWANSLGQGGIIPIQTLFYPCSTFLDLRLTGLQGDVMKESMNVAKTLAWNLTIDKIKQELIKKFEKTKNQGLHIHCPEGSISKDGPSAGAAITTAIYSLFNNKQIKNDIAITGEINLQGEITAIGGLEIKISGGIKAGIKTFLYPEENERDFEEWKSKNEGKSTEADITFVKVSKINDVFQHVFV